MAAALNRVSQRHQQQAVSDRFHQAYAQLNPAQKLAVDTIEGPVMVVAGPGTGKTQVLVTRIANILTQTDTLPQAILALTFTESAAQNMRERLVKLIGQTGYSVRISTFHAFCSELINSYPEYFPIDRGSEPISELERYDLIRLLVGELKLERLQPIGDPYFYIRDIIKAISDIKREGVSPPDFAEMVEVEISTLTQKLMEAEKLTPKNRREAGLPTVTELKKQLRSAEKNQELALIYQSYEQSLRAHKRYDFDDMIGLTIVALKTHELLHSEQQEKLQYFLVDEYQDTNAAQTQVLQLLSEFWGEAANVFVVGDPNQAIYRFQGASLENMLSFTAWFSQATIIALDQGYRCPQEIYTAAAELIERNTLTAGTQLSGIDLTAPLKATTDQIQTDTKIRIVEFPSQFVELWWVAEEIQKLIAAGAAPEKIAVIYRHNRDRHELIEVLTKHQIGFEIDGGSDALSEPTVEQFLSLLRVILDLKTAGTETELVSVLLLDWLGLSRLTILKLARVAQKNRRSLITLLEGDVNQIQKFSGGETVTLAEFLSVQQKYQQLIAWAAADANLTLTAWFESVLVESGFLAWLQTLPDKLYQLTVINSLYAQVKALVASRHTLKLADFLSAITTMQEHHLTIKVDDLDLHTNQVKLTTAHKAKGQEWDQVFMIHCVDKKWGNNLDRKQFKLPTQLLKHTQLDAKDINEDERRLFYVALTRTKQRVTCSYSLHFQNAGHSKPQIASQFLGEFQPTQSETVAAQILRPADYLTSNKVAAQLVQSLQPVVKTRDLAAEKAFFATVLKHYRLSATGLNKYLRDPRAFVLEELIRTPKAKNSAMAYGTAMHRVLETAFRNYQNQGVFPALEKNLQEFEAALADEVLNPADFERRLAQGKISLERYFTTYAGETVQPLMIEQLLGSGTSVTMLGDIRLIGRIDRIDWLDKSAKTARVIDYKTGKPKTANEIIGVSGTEEFTERELALPETIRGPHQRQLLFYKLLTQLDAQFNWEITEGMFDFTEPKTDGAKLTRRFLPLTDVAVRDLTSLIQQVMAELRSLRFVEEW
ncbi:MAG TPA: hypothetical protein DEP87_02505 [Candidatus Pacebacteria bacterium]|nr:hypothetical protein [Candidatus Paceibacterota bacterium]